MPIAAQMSCAVRNCARASARRCSQRSHSPYSRCAGEFDTKAGSAQPTDCLAMTGLGVQAVAEQGPAAGVDSLPRSVWPTLVASGSPVSAPAASRVCPVLQAASISSASAPMEVYSSGACSPGLPRLGQALS